MSPGETVVWWVVAGVGLGGSMLCSGIETGLYATSAVRAAVRARAPGATASDRIVARALDKPERALTTLLLFNNAFNYLGTLAATALLATLALGETAMILLQAAVLTPLLLIFAESLPKELFRAGADRLMRPFAPVLGVMQAVGTVTGLVPLIAGAARLFGRLVGIDAAGALRSPRARTADMLKHGSDQLSQAQAGLIDRALRIESTRVRDEMVPLSAAACVRAGWVASRARREVARRPHAWYPVLDERGRVVGVVRLGELVAQPGATVESLLQPFVRVMHDDSAWDALGAMRRGRASLSIVERDGQQVGIVTQKDLIEPLTGDLRDD